MKNLQHVRTIRMWRGEFGKTPPFDIGPDALFVAYSAWAELTCFMTLGWKFPEHIFDLHTAYLAASNILLPYDPDEVRRSRASACPMPVAPTASKVGSASTRTRSPRTSATGCGASTVKERVFRLLRGRREEIGRAAARHARRRATQFANRQMFEHVLHWSNYSAKAIAQIQAKGMPIDMKLWNLIQENKAAVVGALLRRFDPSHGSDNPIYTPDGEWSYTRFEQWLASVGVTAWPRLQSGRLDIDSDAFRLMYHVPGIEGLHALRDSLGVIVTAKLPIGRDGRNRPSLFPFGTATGRNAHGKACSTRTPAMRSLMVFPPDKIGLYLDWRTQEVGIAAALSEDRGADGRLSRWRHLLRARPQ